MQIPLDPQCLGESEESAFRKFRLIDSSELPGCENMHATYAVKGRVNVARDKGFNVSRGWIDALSPAILAVG